LPIRFRPRDNTFYELFALSAQNLVVGADLLAKLLSDGADLKTLAKDMKETEHQGDEATHAIVKRVNSTFVTPFDREDIYRLAGGLDDVMDFMDEAVEAVVLYELTDLPKGLADQVEVLQRAAELTAEAMPKLRTMKDLEEYWIEINRLENQGDRSYRRIVAKLFSGKYDALTVMKLKDVVDSFEHAIDAFETVANIVEQIAVKES
jgi:predicted phosphate transport protein (TIGR00153 family)